MTTKAASPDALNPLARRAFFSRAAGTLSIALLLSACSGKPSDADAVRAFNELEMNKPAVHFDIENARRIDGYPRDDGFYVVKIQYDMVARVDYEQAVASMREAVGPDSPEWMQLEMGAIPAIERDFGKFKKGQRFSRTKQLLLRRSESGWSIAG